MRHRKSKLKSKFYQYPTKPFADGNVRGAATGLPVEPDILTLRGCLFKRVFFRFFNILLHILLVWPTDLQQLRKQFWFWARHRSVSSFLCHHHSVPSFSVFVTLENSISTCAAFFDIDRQRLRLFSCTGITVTIKASEFAGRRKAKHTDQKKVNLPNSQWMTTHGALLAPFAQHVIEDLRLALLTTSIAPVPLWLEHSAMLCRDGTLNWLQAEEQTSPLRCSDLHQDRAQAVAQA